MSQSSAKTAETRHSKDDELHFWIRSAVREGPWLPDESDESNGSLRDGGCLRGPMTCQIGYVGTYHRGTI